MGGRPPGHLEALEARHETAQKNRRVVSRPALSNREPLPRPVSSPDLELLREDKRARLTRRIRPWARCPRRSRIRSHELTPPGRIRERPPAQQPLRDVQAGQSEF